MTVNEKLRALGYQRDEEGRLWTLPSEEPAVINVVDSCRIDDDGKVVSTYRQIILPVGTQIAASVETARRILEAIRD